MKRVRYSDSSQIVGDEFADVLLEFAAALAVHRLAEPVRFRALGDAGVAEASFLVGPASQIAVEDAHDERPEPDNTDAIDAMRRRIRELAPRTAVIRESVDHESPVDDYDL